MSMTYEVWLASLKCAAVENFFFSPEAALVLAPAGRQDWRQYYEEGFGPEAALEEDLAASPGWSTTTNAAGGGK